MNFEYLREKKELVSILLFGFSILTAVLITVKIAGFFTATASAENIVKRAVEQNNSDAGATDNYLTKYKLLADALKNNNLFAPPQPKQHPVKEVPAIFGDEALINNKWYKVGDMIEDAKIIAIEPTNVKIEWDGREKVFTPLSGSPVEVSANRSRRTRMVSSKRTGQVRTGKAEMVVVGGAANHTGNTGKFESLSEKERAKLELKAKQKQKVQAQKETSSKQSKSNTEKSRNKQKKDVAQKTKRSNDSKPKKNTTKTKTKK